VVYVATIETAASTQKSSPLATELKVSKGLIYKFELYFPPGPSGLVGVRVLQGSHQLYPYSIDEWFLGDREKIEFDDLMIIGNEQTILVIETYNLDDTYQHLIQLRLGILTQPEYIEHYLPSVERANYESFMRKLSERQEAEHQERLEKIIAGLPGGEG